MPNSVPDTLWLAHVGGELGTGHLIVLAVLGIVGNGMLLAPRLFGLLAKGPINRALAEVAGPDARVGSITLPLRGGTMAVNKIRISGLPEISRVEAEIDLLGLRQDPVTIPRIVVSRLPGRDESPGPRGGDGQPGATSPKPESTTGADAETGPAGGPGSSGRRAYDVGTIVIRTVEPDDLESDDEAQAPFAGPETTVDGPERPTDLNGLVRCLVQTISMDPEGSKPTPGVGPRAPESPLR